MKYRKKPVVVKAIQWTGDNWPPVWDFINDRKGNMEKFGQELDKKIKITTLEGVMTADVNDWIIRGIKGELYPCKPDIFEQTYESVDEDDPDREIA